MRAERLISLLMALQRTGSHTAGELAVRLDVSMRTIFRDIDALSAMGVPVYTEPGRGGGIRLVEGYSSDLTGLSSGEAEALALISSPALIGGGELATPTRTALDKLAAAVPSMHQLRAEHARGRLLFDTKAWFRAPAASPFLDELRACVWNDESIEINYQRSDGTHRDYSIEPHALVVKVDTWYLIGFLQPPLQHVHAPAAFARPVQPPLQRVHAPAAFARPVQPPLQRVHAPAAFARPVQQVGRAEQEIRVFRLSRLQSIKRLGRTFMRNPDFDLHKFWHGWCERFEKNPPNNYPVEVIISARGRKRLLDSYGQWFRKRLEPLGAKSRKPVTLDFDREDMALRVLFQLGDDVEIIKPRALRKKLGALAARVVAATR